MHRVVVQRITNPYSLRISLSTSLSVVHFRRSFTPSPPFSLRSLNYLSTNNSGGASNASTIFALSSAPGAAAIAIIRVSGPLAGNVLLSLTRWKTLPLPRIARASPLFMPTTTACRELSSPIPTTTTADETPPLLDPLALCLFFPGPKSATGDDVVEFHVHGGRASVAAILKVLGTIDGLYPATRGAFARRALTAGRLSLLQAESLGDLLAAETEVQRTSASSGFLIAATTRWRDSLVTSLAAIEACIDFAAEEGAIDEDSTRQSVLLKIETTRLDMIAALSRANAGIALRDGVRIAIVGAPNAGKSSLLNAIALRPAALVSPRAGTTRDVLEVPIDVNGIRAILSDTAGLRSDSLVTDEVEIEGMKRATQASSEAHILLFVIDGPSLANSDGIHAFNAALNLIRESKTTSTPTSSSSSSQPPIILIVINKCDTEEEVTHPKCVINDHLDTLLSQMFTTTGSNSSRDVGTVGSNGGRLTCERVIRVSAKTGFGLNTLLNALGDAARVVTWGKDEIDTYTNTPLLTRERHRSHVSAAVKSVNAALIAVRNGNEDEICAEELRASIDAIGKLTGAVGAEDVLDQLFSNFCVGK